MTRWTMATVGMLVAGLFGTGAPAQRYVVPVPPSGGTAAVGPTTFCTDVFSVPVPAGHAVMRPIRDQPSNFRVGRTDASAVSGVSPSYSIAAETVAAGGPPAVGTGLGEAAPATIAGLAAGYAATVKPTRFIVHGKANYAYTVSLDRAGRRYVVTVGTTDLSDPDLRRAIARITLGPRRERGCAAAE